MEVELVMSLASAIRNKAYHPCYLRRDRVPSCCGAGIIHGFPEYRAWMDWTGDGGRRFFLIKDKTIKESQEIIEKELGYYLQEPHSMEMVILNSTQRKYWEEVLFKHDFEIVKDGVYHTYAHLDLTTYMRVRYTLDDNRKITKDNKVKLPKGDPRLLNLEYIDQDYDD
jgi:hypothetical protein